MFLFDAGVWIAAKDSDEPHFESARGLVLDAALPAGALDLTYYEVANVVGVRKGRADVAGELCRTIDVRCAGRVVTVDSELTAEALGVAAEHGLTAYDAAYVAAARRNAWTLVSLDLADLVSKGLAVTPDAALYP